MPDASTPVNITIVPADDATPAPRTYANFCAIAHTPFDFTLTFCDVEPLSAQSLREAAGQPAGQHVVEAPVRARLVVPVQFIPTLVAALQEHMRVFSESSAGSWNGGPVH